MNYVCNNCGKIADGIGTELKKKIKESARCTGGKHDWCMPGQRMTKTAKQALEDFEKEEKKTTRKK